MRASLIVLSLILVLEGLLAWLVGGPPLVGMLAAMVAMGAIASFWRKKGAEYAWAGIVGLYLATAVFVFGVREVGVLVAVSSIHFVAWFFCARALRFGTPDLIPGTLDGRPGIFPVAFYAAAALALVLVRGGMFPIERTMALLIAFLIVVLGLCVMELGKFLKLREGAADRKSRKRGVFARVLALAALVAGLFFVFTKPVPALADGVVSMVLDLQGKSEDTGLDADDMPRLDDVPERDSVSQSDEPGRERRESEAEPSDQQRAGDQMSQARSLPQRADIQGSHSPVVYVELEDESQAAALSRRPLYVRSSTLGSYSAGEWRRVGEHLKPRWIEDGDDGREDGWVRIETGRETAEVRHKVYVRGATGAAMLALQGASSFELHRVVRYDDGWYRAPLVGDVSYGAVSRPLSLEEVISDPEPIRAGERGVVGAYLHVEDTRLMRKIERIVDRIEPGSLAERLLALKGVMASEYTYSQQIDNVDGIDPLENFLFFEKRGYCDFYATAGALMARMMGVPSRVGYGYSKGEFDGESVFTFFEDGAHSWTEIYLEKYGWVVFDLTPAGDSAAGGDGGELAGERERPDLSGFDQEMDDQIGPGGIAGGASDETESGNSAISDLVSYVFFCIALAGFGLWYFLKKDPDREVAGQVDAEGRPAPKRPPYLAEFCHLVESFGVKPQHGETLVEMLKSLRRAGVPVDSFDEMKRYHYSTRYEGTKKDMRQEKQFLQEVRSFLKNQLRGSL